MKAATFLSGPRIVLRPPEAADAGFFLTIRNNVPLQMQLMAIARPNSKRRIEQWLAAANDDERRVVLAIAARRGGRLAGYVQLGEIAPRHGTAELAICLSPAAQGRRYGQEAMTLLEDYAGNVLGLRKLTLRVLGNNTPALSLYRRIGYAVAGTQREQFFQAGKHLDVIWMEKFLHPAPIPAQPSSP